MTVSPPSGSLFQRVANATFNISFTPNTLAYFDGSTAPLPLAAMNQTQLNAFFMQPYPRSPVIVAWPANINIVEPPSSVTRINATAVTLKFYLAVSQDHVQLIVRGSVFLFGGDTPLPDHTLAYYTTTSATPSTCSVRVPSVVNAVELQFCSAETATTVAPIVPFPSSISILDTQVASNASAESVQLTVCVMR